MFLIVVTQASALTPSAVSVSLSAYYQADVVSNGQFVFGPAARQFDTSGYLARRRSPLLPDAPAIEGWCAYASVNPQVVLTLLELDGGQVTYGWQQSLPAAEREAAIAELAQRLAQRFYWHLYEFGERSAGSHPVAPDVTLADGSAVRVAATASSGTYAVLDTLAQSIAADRLSALFGSGPESFPATWERLFPWSDPLDEAVAITPQGLPPADLLQFPFPVGQKWWFNGAHNWNGNGVTYGKPYSSMDFFTSGTSCSYPPAGDWAVAAAGGAGYHPSGYSCWYRIDHAGGWSTSYYHLRNTVGNAQVSANRSLGTIACETCAGGFATGPHVHFSLLYNGAYLDLEGVRLSGWVVRTGNGDYESGGLERDGVLLSPYSSVLNEGIPGAPSTSTPTSTATPTATATRTPTPTRTVTPTNTPSVAVSAKFLYPAPNDLIRTCPTRLVAHVDPPGIVATVRFWMKAGDGWQQIGADAHGSDGWQMDWECQDAPDGPAVLSISADNAVGQQVVASGATTLVTIRKDCPSGTYRTAFFANPTLIGSPASSWCKASTISYKWGAGSPGAGVPGSDNFSARFRGDFWFDAGTYRFSGESDDGVQVWVDRTLVVDAWREHPGGAESFEFTRRFGAGTHEIWLDYFEQSGQAGVALSWKRTGEAQSRIYLPVLMGLQ